MTKLIIVNILVWLVYFFDYIKYYFKLSYGDVTMHHTYGACCHTSLPFFRGKSRKNYTLY